MRTHDKYRFSLQWGAETAEKVQAGDFLESLGNRKSEFVILAITEYLSSHPEALSSKQKLKIIVNSTVTPEQIKAMVTAILEERMSGMTFVAQKTADEEGPIEPIQPDVVAMLNHLDLFSQ